MQPADILKFVVPIVPRDHPDRPDPCPHAEETGYRGDLRTSDHNGSSRDHSPELNRRATASGSSYKTTTTLNVRKEPSTDADRIGKLDPGASVEYLRDHDDTWAVIKYNGQEAYVAKEFLTAE